MSSEKAEPRCSPGEMVFFFVVCFFKGGKVFFVCVFDVFFFGICVFWFCLRFFLPY